MQMAIPPHHEAHRRPAPLDLAAAGLLVATVVLHVVAMFPGYFLGSGTGSSLTSSPDQAALYSVLAASWALALGIGLTGPERTPMAAALAVGVAAGELGFRVADLGDALKYGSSLVGPGLWLMESAWVVGAAAAAVSVLAARRRHATAPPAAGGVAFAGAAAGDAPRSGAEWRIDWAAPAAPGAATSPDSPDRATAPAPFAPGTPDAGGPNPYAGDDRSSEPDGAGIAAAASVTGPTAAMPVPPGASDQTATLPTGEPTSVWEIPAAAPAAPAAPATRDREDDPHERAAWTMLIAVLALLVAGAFLPAWDHAVAYSTVTGRGLTRSLGNAFSGPWQQVVGTVLAAVAMAAVPIVAARLRNRVVGAAAVCGVLLVLASQLAAAVVQVDQPLSPAQIGIGAGQAGQLGLQLALELTGWFTVDALAAYALFAAVMVWANLREHQENSPGTAPSAPDLRRDAIPWAS